MLFGLKLEELELVNEDDAGGDGEAIPVIIAECIAYFTMNEAHIKEQGIFRKAPREDDVKEMERKLIAKDFEFLRSHEDPHVIAGTGGGLVG